MLALASYPVWAWAAFILFVLGFLALDLGLFHRQSREIRFSEALAWVVAWLGAAALFAVGIYVGRDRHEALEFVAGGVIELTLSLDNIFVIALLFSHFGIPAKEQHRVLFWGIVGALFMRGILIGVGAGLINRFEWMFMVLGLFLIFSGLRMLFSQQGQVNPEKNFVLRWARRVCRVSRHLDGQAFVTTLDGRSALTPLAIVLILIETSDLVFALDSVPAIFSITTRPFIVFTSNVFAVLALRSLYIVLAGAITSFRYLKAGLSLVLILIGARMLLRPPAHGPVPWFSVDITLSQSLLATGFILGVAVISSVVRARRDPRRHPP